MNTVHDSYVEDYFDQVLDAFNDCGWQAVLDDVSVRDHTSASQALHEAATRAYDEDNQARGKVLRLLAEACSMILSPEKRNEPFNPLWIGGGMRSTISNDFTEAEIRLFDTIIALIDNPLLKGRLADLVWVKNKSLGARNALIAIDSYLQLPLDVETWTRERELCWQRAIDLSRMIGERAADRQDQIETPIIHAIEAATADDKFFSYRLAHILRSNGLGESDATTVAEKLESLAGEFTDTGDFHASESFFSASANWYKLSGDNEKSVDMTVAQAEAFVEEASARLASDSPSHAVAAGCIENAIQVLRSIPRSDRGRNLVDQRLEELRLLLNEYSIRAIDEMATVSSPPLDVSDTIEQARNRVIGKSVDRALAEFSNLHHTRARKLRESAKESLSESALRAIIPKIFTTHDGRVSSKTPGMIGSTPTEEDELEIRAEMIGFHYQLQVAVAVQALILPALGVLTLEHSLGETYFVELARQSPIVPPGREILFGKALNQGFNLEFSTSIHLLSPQIENMVRFHLKSAGVTTTHLDHEGIETEMGLSTLMDFPETRSIFGEDLTFEVNALFCDPMGPNLRNEIAHGLLDDQQINSAYVVYAWWLGLKLVFNTFWNSLNRDSEHEQQEDA